jgi:hypothetical protein
MAASRFGSDMPRWALVGSNIQPRYEWQPGRVHLASSARSRIRASLTAPTPATQQADIVKHIWAMRNPEKLRTWMTG